MSMAETRPRAKAPNIIPCGSSITGSGKIPCGSSIIEPPAVSAAIAALERDRAGKRVRHVDLCRLAGLDEGTWRNLRRGRQQPQDDTLTRIKAALGGVKPGLTPDVIAGTHRLAMMWLAQETGADVEAMMAQDFSVERARDPVWLRASRLRSYAIYVTAVELQVKNVAIANAIGCSRQNVKQRRDWVEGQRDDSVLNDLLDRCARLVKGRT